MLADDDFQLPIQSCPVLRRILFEACLAGIGQPVREAFLRQFRKVLADRHPLGRLIDRKEVLLG